LNEESIIIHICQQPDSFRGSGIVFMYRIIVLVVFAFFLCPPQQGEAEVANSSPQGFLLKNEVTITAVPDSVFDAVVNYIDSWWDPAHTYSGDSGNLTLEVEVGGCFCEELPYGGGVRHMEVVYISPGKLLRMRGALGPLQASGLAGSMTWSFREEEDSTKLLLSYNVGGYFEGDIEQLAPVVDSVLRGQLLRLKAFVETGSPEVD
jgi:uncharacterized protein YndB with AHSA1/START domain